MDYIKERFKQYISILSQDQTYFTSQKLAQIVHISSRTVKSDMIELNEILKKYQVRIMSKQGKGYILIISDDRLFHELKHDLFSTNIQINEIPKTQQERIDYIIKKMLMLDYHIRIEDLVEELYVSRTTLNHDMRQVRTIFDRYNLEIKSSPYYGMIISGDEISRRRCISQFFFQNNFTEFFAHQNAMFSSVQNQREIRFIREGLLRMVGEYDIRFSDLSIQNIVIHVFIALRRCTIYKYVTFDAKTREHFFNTNEYLAAQSFGKLLEDQFRITLSIDEIVYFAMQIQSKEIVQDSSQGIVSSSVSNHIELIFSIIQSRYGVDFSKNKQLTDFLMLHIPPMVERLRTRLIMRNPILQDILRNYPYAVELTKIAAEIIEQQYQVKMDDNEFGYLVLYFNVALRQIEVKVNKRIVLVCGRGRPETILFLNDLSELFQSIISEVEVFDVYQLSPEKLSSTDVVITTIPMPQVKEGVTQIFVRSNVKDYYGQIHEALVNKDYINIDFHEYINKSLFMNNIEVDSKEDCLNLIFKHLKEIGIPSKDLTIFFQNILPYGCEIGNGVVCIRSIYDLPSPFIFTAVLKKEILWNSQYVQVLCIVSLNWKDFNVVEQVYQLFSQWCRTEQINDLIRYQNYERYVQSMMSIKYINV